MHFSIQHLCEPAGSSFMVLLASTMNK